MEQSREKITVVIAEDNVDFQVIIQDFVKPLEMFQVIGEANDGLELIEVNDRLKPDLLLIDIQMPNLNGMDAFKECLKTNPSVKCIFITAYDEYAIEAFDLNAVDYIIKPIEKERLYLGLERAKDSIEKESFFKKKNGGEAKRLLIKFDRDLYVIPMASILYIEKVNRKTYIHTTEGIFVTYETLDTLMKSLDGDFFASHRSYIINMTKVSLVKNDGETNFVYFYNYEQFAHVSKRRIQELQKKLTEYNK